MLASLLPGTPVAAAARPATTPAVAQYMGDVSVPAGVRAASVRAASAPGQEIAPAITKDIQRTASKLNVTSGAPSNEITAGSLLSGFDGINHYQQRSAGTGAYTNTQFSLEPPDQGLCVGGGYILEPVNTALSVYNTSGQNLTGAVALNQFFGLTPEINRTTGVRGAFTSDPKCYYDAGGRRSMLTMLVMGQTQAGGFQGPSFVYIAVSKTPDPTKGWRILRINTTDNGRGGTPSHPGCPCFGDQPLIGADAYGFYVSTNELSINGPNFNGTQIYALSRVALENSKGGVNALHIDVGSLPTPDAGGIWYSVQPATNPPGASFAPYTEYFMSSLDFFGAGDNRIAVWRLTGTNTLGKTHPAVALSETTLTTSTAYGATAAFGASQMAGTNRPLGNSLGQPEELLNANDDRMNQVMFDGSHLWGAVNTILGGGTVGIAYWQVGPFAPSVTASGYVGSLTDNVIFPSIGVNAGGQAVMAFTLTGPDYFPSAAYSRWDGSTGTWGPIEVSGAGTAPEDGFTGYEQYGGNGIARWGDYSAAVANESGYIWTANEYIPNDPRTTLANWGTFVAKVNPV